MATKAYDKSFREEVYQNVDSGEDVKLCMQCGVCGITCPLRGRDDPRTPVSSGPLFAPVNAMRCMNSPDIMLCTSCYSCKVRCPRGVKVIDVMHGLAHYALEQGIVPRKETSKFGKAFWDSIYKTGRVDETEVPMRYTMMAGPIHGIFNMLEMMDIGRALAFPQAHEVQDRPRPAPFQENKGGT